MKPDLKSTFCAEMAKEKFQFVTRNGQEVTQLTYLDSLDERKFVGVIDNIIRHFNKHGECTSSSTMDLFHPLQEPELDKSKLPDGWGCEYKGMSWDNGGRECYYTTVNRLVLGDKVEVSDYDFSYKFIPVGSSDQHYWLLTPPTSREDGTPLSIPPLPEIKGYRLEYRGLEWGSSGSEYIMYGSNNKWSDSVGYSPWGLKNCHYAEAFPISKPTTLEDLFPLGESNCWVHFTDITGSTAKLITQTELITQQLSIGSEFPYRFDRLAKEGLRYSNHPLTKFENAKPFIA